MASWFRVGQAAAMLGVSEHHVRRLCEEGLLEAERTEGGHWRICLDAILRMKRTGVPPIPQSLNEEDYPDPEPWVAPEGGRAEHGLPCAGPPKEVVESEAAVKITENLVRQRRVQLELDQADEQLQENREQRHLRARAQEQQRREEMAALRATAERPWWTNYWLRRALAMVPPDVPPEIRAEVYRVVQERLEMLNPTQPYSLTYRLVKACVGEALAPWRRQRRIDELLRQACQQLPSAAKGSFASGGPGPCHPNRWEIQVIRQGAAAIRQLGEDATWSEMEATVFAAAEDVAAGFKHAEKCEEIICNLDLSGVAPGEHKKARDLVREALSKLPVGASHSLLQAAKDDILKAFRSSSTGAR